ncbi:MAG TPA: POTRA domain-containing protein [Bacteroidota bacterium]|nr:POTRA domain-containing protein [Bacteroidota bacterium]
MVKIVIIGISFLYPCMFFGGEKTTIHSIHIDGNQAMSSSELLGRMISKERSPYLPSQLSGDVQSLLQLYHQRGYYYTEIRIDSLFFNSESVAVDIFLAIEEGVQATIGTIDIKGSTVFSSEEILQQFETRVGEFLDQETIERDIASLLSTYEKIGYPFISIKVTDISIYNHESSARLRVELLVDEGSKVKINEIQVRGNKETQDQVVVRETRIKLNEDYNHEKVVKIPDRLNRLNIFSSVHDPELYVNATGGGILIEVEEGNTNTFDGVFGYVPSSISGESGVLSGMVDVSMRNLFGTARRLNIHWLRDDRHSQEVALYYREPWLLDYPVNMSGSFFQRQQDTIYVQRTVEIKADFLLTESWSIGGLFNHEVVIPSSQILQSGTQSVLGSRTITSGIEVQFDSRNDLLSPTAGVFYRTDYRVGNKKIFDKDETSTVQKVSLDAELIVGTYPRQVAVLGLHGRQRTSVLNEVSDFYRLGGARTLRGYRENQFRGSRVAWTNVEYRFLLARRSFLFGFFDTGYFFVPGDERFGVVPQQSVKYGYGLGIRLETSLGNIGVSFALGEGDSFNQAKIHIGLVNQF